MRLLDTVQTETNQIQKQSNPNREESETGGGLHLTEFTVSAGEAGRGERGRGSSAGEGESVQ